MRAFLRDLAIPVSGATLNFAPTAMQRAFASLLAPGVVTAFALAQQIIGTLFSVGLRTVNVAGHPQIARYAVKGEFGAMNGLLDRSIALATATGVVMAVYTTVLVPDAVGMAVVAGALEPERAEFLVRILLILVCTLPLNGCVRVLRSPHYALSQPRVPGLQMAIMGVLHMALLYGLFRVLEAEGIALAQVLWVVGAVALGFVWKPPHCDGIFRRNAPAVAIMLGVGIAACGAALGARAILHDTVSWGGYGAHGLSMLFVVVIASVIALPATWPVWRRVRNQPGSA